jgi:hypothetical protein
MIGASLRSSEDGSSPARRLRMSHSKLVRSFSSKFRLPRSLSTAILTAPGFTLANIEWLPVERHATPTTWSMRSEFCNQPQIAKSLA